MNFFGIENPIFNDTIKVCNIEFNLYYYIITNKGEKKKFTPFKKDILDIDKFEGIYHPACKILLPEYSDYTTIEYAIKKKSNEIYNYKTGKEEISKLTNVLIVSIIVCALHSMRLRMQTDKQILAKGREIEKYHIKAAYFTYNIVMYHLEYLKKKLINNENLYNCIVKDLAFLDLPLFLKFYEYAKSLNNSSNTLEINKNMQNMQNNKIKKKLFVNE